MIEVLSTLFALLGAFFITVASIGILRMPDLFLRMSATSKASTLGSALTLIAAMIFFQDFSVTTRCLATILFLILTTPVAAHMIGRAGYLSGVRLWERTITDELAGHYNAETRRLEGAAPTPSPAEPQPEKTSETDRFSPPSGRPE